MTTISDEGRPGATETTDLYRSVGWTAYTSDPATLVRAITGSSYVVTARDADGRLIGLARAVSDDASICYVQDILVAPAAQRSGTGRAMVQAVLERYRHVRQLVLITDDEEGQRLFYESLGFTDARDVEPHALRAFVKLN